MAIDYLVKAFLAHSEVADFSFVVSGEKYATFHMWAINAEYTRAPQVRSAAEMARDLRIATPDVWLNLHGEVDVGPRLRDRIATALYPTVSVQHGLSNHQLLYNRYFRMMLTPTYECDSLVCTSNACKRALAKMLEHITGAFGEEFGTHIGFRGRLDVIPLCIDTEQFRPGQKAQLRKQLNLPEHAILLLYVGYLTRAKADLLPLLPVVRRLIADNRDRDIRLLIAGTGPNAYIEAVQHVVREYQLSNKVTLYREVSDNVKVQLLAGADIFVAPCDSMQESFGLTPVEAMACGLPQVVADWSGYRETVVDGHTGFLVPTTWGMCDDECRITGEMHGWYYDHVCLGQSIVLDMEILYQRVNDLIRSSELRDKMSAESRARAVTEFGYKAVARRYDQLWTDLAVTHPAKLAHAPRKRWFDQPRYCDMFGHFATRALKDTSIVRRKATDGLEADKVINLVAGEFLHTNMFDTVLLQRIQQELVKTDAMAVRDLIAICTNDEITSPDAVRRHLLFLSKHGWMSIGE